MNLYHWREAVAERLERWRLSVRASIVAPIVQPILIAVLVMLVTYFAAMSYRRFEDIITNQNGILAQYGRIEKIDAQRVSQNAAMKATLEKLKDNDADITKLCVDALREHTNDTKQFFRPEAK